MTRAVWRDISHTGRIFCAMHKGGGILRHSITTQSIFLILMVCGQIMGLRFAPHDARRSFAKLAHRSHAALEQIQLTLGHTSFRLPNAISASVRIYLTRPAIIWDWILRSKRLVRRRRKRANARRNERAKSCRCYQSGLGCSFRITCDCNLGALAGLHK